MNIRPFALVVSVALTVGGSVACEQAEQDDRSSDSIPGLEGLGAWSLDEELRVGSADFPDGFWALGEVEVAPDGSIYVLDERAHEVRVFGPEGEPLRRFGRVGDGPGEFRSPSALGFLGDTLWVRDARRITLYSADGTLARTIPIPEPVTLAEPGQSPISARGLHPGPDGFLHPSYSFSTLWEGMEPYGDSMRVRRIVFDPEGNPVDTGMHETVFPSPHGFTQIQVQPGGFSFPVQTVRFHETPIRLGLLESPIVVYRQPPPSPTEGRIVVTWLDGATGAAALRREYRVDPVPLPREDVDNIIDGQVDAVQRSTGGLLGVAPTRASLREALREAMTFPDFLPPVTQARLGRDGSVWLRREDLGRDSVPWAVLDSVGTPSGEVWLPRGANVQVISRDHLWAVVRDELDVSFVIRYRIERGG